MAEIIPAILERSLEDIESKLRQIRGAAKSVQIDVCDGIFVQHKTWPYEGREQRDEFERLSTEDSGLPLWEDFNFEADLMIEHPEREIEKWVSAGFSKIVLHADSEGALFAAQGLQSLRLPEQASSDSLGVKVGIALPSNASLESLTPFNDLYDYVQVMGIAHIGVQGEPQDEHALMLIEQLRQAHPELTIQVDGGVRESNVRKLAQAGANMLIAGSAIFGSDNPKQALEMLEQAANHA